MSPPPTLLILLVLSLSLLSPFASPNDDAGGAPVFKAAMQLTSPSSLRERKLLTIKLQLDDLMKQYYFYSATPEPRRFRKEVLGFITPWNGRGYDTAVTMHRLHKLDFAVPVWFRVIKQTMAGSAKQEVHIAGVDDINIEWLAEMRTSVPSPSASSSSSSSPSSPKHTTYILPRVKVETDLGEADVAVAVKLLSHLQDKHALQVRRAPHPALPLFPLLVFHPLALCSFHVSVSASRANVAYLLSR